MTFNSFFSEIGLTFFMSHFTLLLVAVTLKCVLISIYCGLLYLCVCAAKKFWGGAMSARSGYYCWYALLLCLPISALDFNYAIKQPFYNFCLNVSYDDGTIPALWKICCAAAVVWFLIVLYRLERQIITNIRLEGAIAALREADADGFKNKTAAAFGLNSNRISVVAADWVTAAVTFGVFRKSILLPGDYKTRYSENELYTVLLHEMAHIKNHDTVKLYFINLAKCVFFIPNRFVEKFTRDSEILCDNRVMGAADIGRDTYGDMLLKECSAEHSLIKGLAFSDSFLSLQSRIDALYKFSPEKRRLTIFAIAVFILLFMSFASDCLTFDNLTLGSTLPKADVFIMPSNDFSAEQSSQHVDGLSEGVFEFLGTGVVRFDRIKMYESLKPLMDQGIEIDSLYLTISDESPYLYFKDETGARSGINDTHFELLSMNELEGAVDGELEAYGTINRFPLRKFLLYIALQWL